MLPKFFYWLLSLTWGIIMTIIGFILTLFFMCCGHKPKRNIYGWYIEIDGEPGTGISFGPCSIVTSKPDQDLLNHEFGHSIQNCYFGPLFIFIIAIPSLIRCLYREYLVIIKKKKYSQLPDYDAIWFEGNATKLGYFYFETRIE